MDDMNEMKQELLDNNQRLMSEILSQVTAVNWGKRKPTSSELVLLADFHKLLLAEAWLKDVEMRFQIERAKEMTGLDDHELTLYVEIGGWIALDRHLAVMTDEEEQNFWDTMASLDEIVKEEDVVARASEEKRKREEEIAELNRLLGFDS